MKRLVLSLSIAGLWLLGIGPAAAADAPIGAVTRVQGEAHWRAGNRNAPLTLGAPVFTSQRVATGEDARLELTFDDGTAVTLGENAQLTLDSFVYDPSAGTGRLKAAVRGAFRFVSGELTKQPTTQVAVATPYATIGIRGTDFWGGPIDEQALGVFLIEGSVSVTNAAGEQVLDASGQGTNIATPGDAPGPVTTWPDDKVQRALATVTFQ
jgi:hypothetical protein